MYDTSCLLCQTAVMTLNAKDHKNGSSCQPHVIQRKTTQRPSNLPAKRTSRILCSYTHFPCIHTCFQVHPQPRFLGSGVYNLPSLRCAADACVHAGHEQVPGLWAASSGPRAPTQSWTRGNTASHFPATAASSAPERYLLLYPTSLQSTKSGEKKRNSL